MYNMVHKQNKYHHKYDLIHFYKKQQYNKSYKNKCAIWKKKNANKYKENSWFSIRR